MPAAQAQVVAKVPDPTRNDGRRAFIAAGLGWGLDGVTWMMYSFALTVVLPVLGISKTEAGWITAASIVASAIGGVVCGTLADRFGRVRVLTWVILGYSLFTGLTATSQNLEQFLLWRVLEGFAFGGEWAVGAALVAEYASPSRRGRVLGMESAGGGMQTVETEVPLAEVSTYARTLSSMTGGQGSFTMEFSHYDVVPGNVQKEIISKAALKDEEED